MLSWIASWWSTKSFTGPARNAPNNGQNIKELFEQKPASVIVLTDKEIQSVRSTLKKTEINSDPPSIVIPPIMMSLNNVFQQGNENYFESVKQRRLTAKLNIEKLNIEKLEADKVNTESPKENKQTIDVSLQSVPKQNFVLPELTSFTVEEIIVEISEFQNI